MVTQQQIFKDEVPPSVLWDFLTTHSLVTGEQTRTFTKILYKKCVFNNIVQPWLLTLKPYYHLSKVYFVERPMTYLHFLTVLRQLCHLSTTIEYKTELSYANSGYEIVYHFENKQ